MIKKEHIETKEHHTFLRNPYFWILIVLFLAVIILHYPHLHFIPIKIEISSYFGLERHAVERILLLIPISLAAYIFGLPGGFISLFTAFFIMIPRVFTLSNHKKDALFETLLTIAIGLLINWWLESRRKEISLREQALLKLEEKKEELQSQIKIVEESKNFISALHSISAIINHSLTLEEVLDTTTEKIKQVMNIDIVLIFFLSNDSSLLKLSSHRGVSEKFIHNISGLHVGDGFNGFVAKTGKPLFVQDITQDERYLKDKIADEGIKSVFIVPLKSKETILGTLCVAKRSFVQFSHVETNLLTLIGNEIGMAAEKDFFLHELRKMGKRFQEIFEKANDAIWIQNESGHIISANLATALLTGYSLQELNSINISQFLKPEAIQKAQDLEKKLINGINVHQPYEQEIKKRNGEEAILMLTTSLLGTETTPVFLKIARDITEEKKMQAHLRLYADQINTAYEEERKRIARELHDDTIQTLVSISRSLDNYITKLGRKEKNISGPLDTINNNIDDALIRIRRFVHDLRPPTLEYLGLIPALRELVQEARDQSKIEINLSFTPAQFPFTREQELLIYRIIQEALSNIRKHSQATKADISLSAKGKEVIVEVRDNGQGFEIINGPIYLEKGKLGLMGMKERSHLLGGSLDISSKPGKGTTITLHL